MSHEGKTLAELRSEIDCINSELLALFSRRAVIAAQIHRLKRDSGRPIHEPERELEMLASLVSANRGPLSDTSVERLFHELFAATKAMMDEDDRRALMVARSGRADHSFEVGKLTVGEAPLIIAGPCAVEGALMIEQSARFLASRGVPMMRGGAYKPRTSPYEFQGLGEAGLRLLADAAHAHGLLCVTEIVDPRNIDLVCEYADVLQVGSRNMQNFELLKEVARARRPVLLKRGLAATLDEFMLAAEYILSGGNDRIILCERGIRTFETQTRNTLDVSAVALLRRMTHLPVIVDVSHAAGRRDILAPLARAGLAAGAQGVMIEVHPSPATARSDSQQQLDFEQFDAFHRQVFARSEQRTIAC